jgi:multiple sugar transport system permease protein
VLIFIVVGVFSANWGDFYGPLIYMRKSGNETLAFKIFLEATSTSVGGNKENLRMAAGTFMSVFPLILFFVFQKQLIEGIATTGIKG